MTQREKKNVTHSVLERLRNRARANDEAFDLVLTRYGMERFLYRLSISPDADRFVLKGASLFLIWRGQSYRISRDADFLVLGDSNLESLKDVFREVCEIGCSPSDGMMYDPETLKVQAIKENQEYDGVRITLMGMLNQVRIPLQIDVGFGDAITPVAEQVHFPTLLDGPAPQLKAYPRYSVVAEKFEAMIKLGLANSRMKDFYDVVLLSRMFEFEGKVMGEALTNTFSRRRTPLPQTTPECLTSAFCKDTQKLTQWNAFVRNAKPVIPVGDLSAVVEEISGFVMPLIERLHRKEDFPATWFPGRGWEDVV